MKSFEKVQINVAAVEVSKKTLHNQTLVHSAPSSFLHLGALRGDAAMDVRAVAASSVWKFTKMTLALM